MGKGTGGGWRKVELCRGPDKKKESECMPTFPTKRSPADTVTVPELSFKGANKEPGRATTCNLLPCFKSARGGGGPEAMGHSHENPLIYRPFKPR